MIRGNLIKIVFVGFIAFICLLLYYKSSFKFEHWGYSSKVWAHRVNSIEKLEYVQKKFAGIELDIVFDLDKNIFDVNHPPAKSIDLSLNDYLSHIEQKDMGIWLDFKNLTQENYQIALNRLLFLVDLYKLQKDSIIIESQNVSFLKIYKEVGFRTSYYLPTFLNRLPTKDLKNKLIEIKENLILYKPNAISTNLVDYEIIAIHFPHEIKYLWSIDKILTTRYVNNIIQTRKALNDPKVEVLLVHVTNKKGHR